MKSLLLLIFFLPFFGEILFGQEPLYKERHRNQYHFSPPAHWMNDPNGMIYYQGNYHLFYQYYPDSTVWGPMHWGHTISEDLIHWRNESIALYPDSLGYIFSGSVVVDKLNTSDFQNGKNSPLVAIFTYHNMKGEKSGSLHFQYQGIAYSLDKGMTWRKYFNNPVLKNIQDKRDFRDPKVFWYAPLGKWVMTLAVGNKVEFYQSPNLKEWKLTGEFGINNGSHGGVWECPDLFPIKIKNTNEEKWVLLVSIGTGALNGGSGTQYFVGSFDGKTFINENAANKIMWVDNGTDNYAGVTWSNAPDNKRIFLGWMSNWQYAQLVPTSPWRSSMTLPRELNLERINNQLLLTSAPVEQIKQLRGVRFEIPNGKNLNIGSPICEIEIKMKRSDLDKGVSIKLSNKENEFVIIGYNKNSDEFYIDRTHAGESNFYKGFASRHTAKRLSNSNEISLNLYFDIASVEMFADGGTVTMTDIFFPTNQYTSILVSSIGNKTANFKALGYGLRQALPQMK